MECSKCVLCFKDFVKPQIENTICEPSRNVDSNVTNTFYKFLLKSTFGILSTLQSDNCWSSSIEFSRFCDSCERKVLIVFDLSLDVKEIQTTIQWLIHQIKIRILKSISFDKRNICKVVSQANLKDCVSLSDKVDCFRSLAIIEFNPDVTILGLKSSTQSLCLNVSHLEKEKFRCFWKSTSSAQLKECISENEIIRVTGIKKELLTLTDDEMDSHFDYINGTFRCKLCGKKLKNRRYAIKHVVSQHRNIKKYKCQYCGKGYYDRTLCRIHILNHHDNIQDNPTIKNKTCHKYSKCINCYTDIVETAEENRKSHIFYAYCDLLKINYSHPYFNWSSTSSEAEIPKFCDSCYSSVVTLCDLSDRQKEMMKAIDKAVLQIKADILDSMSQERQKINCCKIKPSLESFDSLELSDKVNYVRSLVVQDFNPELRIFKLEMENQPLPAEHKYRNGQRTLCGMLNNGECINLNPGHAVQVNLSDEETELYLKYDARMGTYNCLQCSSKHKCKRKADVHVNKIHKQLINFECKYCGKQFFLKNHCAYHIINSHRNERQLDESIATPVPNLIKLTTQQGILDLGAVPQIKNYEIKSLPNGKGYQCMLCSAVHKNRYSTMKHQKSYHFKLARYQCEFCGYKHLARCSVEYHIQKVHFDEVKRRKIIFDSMSSHISKKIQRLQKGKVKVPVNMAGIIPVERKEVTANAEDHFVASKVGFTCNQCGLLLTNKLKMTYHVESKHFGIRTCECAICGKRFHRIVSCRNHIRKHDQAKLSKSMLISGDTIVHDFNKAPSAPVSDNISVNFESKKEFATVLKSTNTDFESDKHNSAFENYNFKSVIINGDWEVTQSSSLDLFRSTDLPNAKIEEPLNSNCDDSAVDIKFSETFLHADNSGEHQISISLVKKVEENVLRNEISESPALSIEDSFITEQEEMEDVADSLNDPLHLENQHPTNAIYGNGGNTTNPPSDRAAFVYTLIKEDDVIVLPDVDSSQIFKYFTKIGNKKWKCLKCGRMRYTENKVKRHVEEFHGLVKRYQCSNCLKLFNTKFFCAEHFVVKHTGHKLYTCSICGNSVGSNVSLKSHIKRHLDRQFTCSVCQRKFGNYQDLKNHCKHLHKN